MHDEQFNQVIEAAVDRSMSVLVMKNAAYSGKDVDRLAGVKHAAHILGTTPEKAIEGMMVKHTSSIYTMLRSGESYTRETWNEKITDHINYLLLLEAVIHEKQGVVEAIDNSKDRVNGRRMAAKEREGWATAAVERDGM